ncbi:hypothetical protein SARC_07719 [Sphaeroforma arctica JP610]|uniref:Uncharacterized protein n=1 Tax=Sphaeroforma arctica JP610 TaxID=667725 RepID=A0A0L0FT73_9EUKA|nr:hypothetical protein SARC_07719 [Sphaeroforma arctica JP610]KNC79899.1 hypothetical protein SARC_07719 [Sphaeroforma arctica JP610]|eukprot:XP_014153801.1 hypothetical protein SARC_07719 [Sphaeroforma arctica JP610]
MVPTTYLVTDVASHASPTRTQFGSDQESSNKANISVDAHDNTLMPTSALQSQVPQQQMQNQQQQQQQRRRQQQIQQSQQQTQEAQQATQPHQPQHAQQFAQPPQQHTHQHKEQVTQQQPPHAQAQAPVPSLQQSVTPSAMPQSAMPQSHTPATQPYSTEGMTPQSTQPPLAGPELNQSHQTTAPHGQAHADTSKSSASIPTTGETNTVVLNTESSTESSTPGASSAEQVNSTAETVQDITLVQPTLPAGNPDVPILPTQQ